MTHIYFHYTAPAKSTVVSEAPPWYQLQFDDQRRAIKRYEYLIQAVRANLDAYAKGQCSAETALAIITKLVSEETP